MIFFLLEIIRAVSYGIVTRNFEPTIDSEGSQNFGAKHPYGDHVPGAVLYMKPSPVLPNFDTVDAYGYYDDFTYGGNYDF